MIDCAPRVDAEKVDNGVLQALCKVHVGRLGGASERRAKGRRRHAVGDGGVGVWQHDDRWVNECDKRKECCAWGAEKRSRGEAGQGVYPPTHTPTKAAGARSTRCLCFHSPANMQAQA